MAILWVNSLRVQVSDAPYNPRVSNRARKPPAPLPRVPQAALTMCVGVAYGDEGSPAQGPDNVGPETSK
jgi:hypothetical protein